MLFEVNMCVERQRQGYQLNHEKVESERQITQPHDQGSWNQKVWCVIAFGFWRFGGNYVIACILGVVKMHVILEKSSAEATVAEISMK